MASCSEEAFWKPTFVNKAKSAPGGTARHAIRHALYLDELLLLEDSVGLCTRKLRMNIFARWRKLEARTVNESGEDHSGLRVDDDDDDDGESESWERNGKSEPCRSRARTLRPWLDTTTMAADRVRVKVRPTSNPTSAFCVFGFQKCSRTGSKHSSPDYLREHSQYPHPKGERIGSRNPHAQMDSRRT